MDRGVEIWVGGVVFAAFCFGFGLVECKLASGVWSFGRLGQDGDVVLGNRKKGQR